MMGYKTVILKFTGTIIYNVKKVFYRITLALLFVVVAVFVSFIPSLFDNQKIHLVDDFILFQFLLLSTPFCPVFSSHHKQLLVKLN